MNSKKNVLKDIKYKFSQCEGTVYTVPQHELFEELWLKNGSSDLLEKARELNIPKYLLMYFYKEFNEDMVYRFENALEYWDSITDSDSLGLKNGSGNYSFSSKFYICVKENDLAIHREATPNEVISILEAESKVCKELGITRGYKSIAKDNLWSKFDELIKEELRKMNIECFYDVYSFVFLRENLD